MKGCAKCPYMEMGVFMQISNIERSFILEISEFINIRIRCICVCCNFFAYKYKIISEWHPIFWLNDHDLSTWTANSDLLCTFFPSLDLFWSPCSVQACACALENERSRTLRDSLAEAVFVAGFVPAGWESGGLMISPMLCVDQGHGTVWALGLGKTRERERGNNNQELNSWITHHFYIHTQLPVQIYIYTSVLCTPHLFPVMII